MLAPLPSGQLESQSAIRVNPRFNLSVKCSRCRVPQRPPYQSYPGADQNRINVGVLPFLAPQPLRRKVLAWSFTQEIAVGLAQFHWLQVTGPTQSKDERAAHLVDDDLACRELDYLVDGALWNQFDALQIRIRLLSIANGARETWSEHFEFGDWWSGSSRKPTTIRRPAAGGWPPPRSGRHVSAKPAWRRRSTSWRDRSAARATRADQQETGRQAERAARLDHRCGRACHEDGRWRLPAGL